MAISNAVNSFIGNHAGVFDQVPLGGQHPQTPEQIGVCFEQTAQG